MAADIAGSARHQNCNEISFFSAPARLGRRSYGVALGGRFSFFRHRQRKGASALLRKESKPCPCAKPEPPRLACRNRLCPSTPCSGRSGHVGIEELDELIRICRPGGVIVLTVKNTLWEGGFASRVAELEAAGVVARVEETAPYVSMPGEQGTVRSRGLVLRRG